MILQLLPPCLGAVLLAACAVAQSAPPPIPVITPLSSPAPQAAPAAALDADSPPAAAAASNPSKRTDSHAPINPPPRGNMSGLSLSEYRARIRDQLIQSENARPDVADCAAHASWIVPRSVSFDQFRLPTGALSQERTTVEPWNGRFSPGKQGGIHVSSVVGFRAAAHRRGAGRNQWEPVRVRCGYHEDMMLAYELLDAKGQPFASPAPVKRARAQNKRRMTAAQSAKRRGGATQTQSARAAKKSKPKTR